MRVYDETRAKYRRPLTLLASEKLIECVQPSDYVLIVTNSVEMDGPPGAAALARALLLGLRAIPVIISDFIPGTKYERSLTQSLIGCQVIPVFSKEELKGSIWTPYTAWVYNWPHMTVVEAEKKAEKLLDELKPKAIITVEAISCNTKGIKHGALGAPMNSGDSEERIIRWNQLIEVAKKRGILTIATGDNGNECGFYTIKEILMAHHKYCRNCGCSCGAGIVSAAGAEIVIPATSSNWAAYGIEACLARLLDNFDVMHDEYTHNRMLLNCANEGIPDGATAMPTPSTDGCSHETCMTIITQLRQTLLMSVKEIVREKRGA
ncbi:MAG: glutamate cyclase domain-containing protein [Candidatus Hermodarchaeota archaeon]